MSNCLHCFDLFYIAQIKYLNPVRNIVIAIALLEMQMLKSKYVSIELLGATFFIIIRAK